MNRKTILTSVIFLCKIYFLQAQSLFKTQVPEEKKYDTTIVDPDYGILLYEKLNINLSSDSVRMCGTYACQSWKEDYYTNGKLLHKGFYIDGQLRSYKNYYPNGQLERDFRSVDNYASSMKLYYPNGQLKSDIKYKEGDNAVSWTDYYPDGKIKLQEQKVKNKAYFEFQKYFYKNGNPESELLLSDKKKLVYLYIEYYENGKIKVEGTKFFDTNSLQYIPDLFWKHYNSDGKPTKEVTYDKGTKINEKNL
jgi:antitoxin component YwqK of YwqJK toxin-antitoxin module